MTDVDQLRERLERIDFKQSRSEVVYLTAGDPILKAARSWLKELERRAQLDAYVRAALAPLNLPEI